MTERLDYIDITKGIGIILVVLSHTDYSDIMHYTLAFYVPIFFFCSGYTTSQPQIGLKENFRHHAIKLLKPYLFFNIILLLIFHQFYFQGLIGIFYSRYCLYPSDSTEPYRFFINGNYPLWFLTCMIVAYFLLYLIIYQPKYQFYIGGAYLAITVLLSHLPILLPWSIDTAFLMALFMYIGWLIRQKIPNLFSAKIHPFIIIAAIFYFLLLPFCKDINLSVREYGTSIATCIIAGLTGCIITIFLAKLLTNTLTGNILHHIGRHSLTIFCIEIPFIVLIGRPIASNLLDNCTSQQISNITTSIIETVIACTGGYLISVFLHNNKIFKKILF